MSARHRPVPVLVGCLVLCLGLLVAACGGDDADGPPQIVEGRTQCDECQMIIDDVSFAAAYRLPDGAEKNFDDIGDMLAHGERNDELGEAEIWVFDRDSGDPLRVEDATFVVSGGSLSTPMGWGIVAFADEETAGEAAAAADGRLVDWPGLMELSTAGEVGAHLSDEHSDPAGPTTTDHQPEMGHDDHGS